jgi:hypothetical protein
MTLQLMLTRIIIIYIAVRLACGCSSGRPQDGALGANIRVSEAQPGDLGVFAQACGDNHQPQQLEQTVGDERHQRRRDGTRENGRHVI